MKPFLAVKSAGSKSLGDSNSLLAVVTATDLVTSSDWRPRWPSISFLVRYASCSMVKRCFLAVGPRFFTVTSTTSSKGSEPSETTFFSEVVASS